VYFTQNKEIFCIFQYKMTFKEESRYLNGKVSIKIGTTRKRLLGVRAESTSQLETRNSITTISRPAAQEIVLPTNRVRNDPPNYSQLSSRSTSVMSFETCK